MDDCKLIESQKLPYSYDYMIMQNYLFFQVQFVDSYNGKQPLFQYLTDKKNGFVSTQAKLSKNKVIGFIQSLNVMEVHVKNAIINEIEKVHVCELSRSVLRLIFSKMADMIYKQSVAMGNDIEDNRLFCEGLQNSFDLSKFISDKYIDNQIINK